MIFNVNSLNIKINDKKRLNMAIIDGDIQPIYFLITSIAFIILALIQYKNFGKTLEAIYLSGLSAFFIFSYFALISFG